MRLNKPIIVYDMIKTACLLLSVLVLSACSTHHVFHSQGNQTGYPVSELKKQTPHYANVDQGQLEYYRFGHGSPIVLITGYVSDVTSWDRDFIADLASQHELIVFNNRLVAGSHGQSSTFLCKDLARDTHELIQQLHLKKPTVLGISMGGMIAEQYAVLYPHSLSHLVLINTALAGNAVRPTLETENSMKNIPSYKIGRFMVAVELFFPSNERLPMAISLINNRFLPESYQEVDPKVVAAQQMIAVQEWVRDKNTAKEIAKLKLPVLILNGEADQVIPPVNSEMIAATIKHSRLLRWKNGGHAMIYQYPHALADAINQFVVASNDLPRVSGTKK